MAAGRPPDRPERCAAIAGTGEHELLDAGAVAVYDDAAAILSDLDGGPLASLLR